MMRSDVTFPIGVGIRLDRARAEKLKTIAEREDRRPSTLARRLLSEAIDRYQEGVPVT